MTMRKILILLAVMTLSLSCGKDSKQDWSGMEYFTFEITGKVTDPVGNPLKGIVVEALGDEAFTRADGTYTLEGTGSNNMSVAVNFSDTDEEDNGGYYLRTSVKVDLDYVKGKHGPYLGLYAKEGVNASMIPGAVDKDSVMDPNVPLQ